VVAAHRDNWDDHCEAVEAPCDDSWRDLVTFLGVAMTIIRQSTPEDENSIREVCRQAFGGEDEGRLVDALRQEGYERLALVAEKDGDVIGVIVFSELAIVTESASIAGLALAPLAVLPAHQRRGVGSLLVNEGLRICRDSGHGIVIVLGHPEYYPRFGFSAESALPLKSPYAGPSFMALALSNGALDDVTGEVRYPPAFDAF
jgi:putative acetyltransferase